MHLEIKELVSNCTGEFAREINSINFNVFFVLNFCNGTKESEILSSNIFKLERGIRKVS